MRLTWFTRTSISVIFAAGIEMEYGPAYRFGFDLEGVALARRVGNGDLHGRFTATG